MTDRFSGMPIKEMREIIFKIPADRTVTEATAEKFDAVIQRFRFNPILFVRVFDDRTQGNVIPKTSCYAYGDSYPVSAEYLSWKVEDGWRVEYVTKYDSILFSRIVFCAAVSFFILAVVSVASAKHLKIIDTVNSRKQFHLL